MSDNPFNDNPFAVGTSSVRFQCRQNHIICIPLYAFPRAGEHGIVERWKAICGCRRVLTPKRLIRSPYMLRVTICFCRSVMEEIQCSPHQPGEAGRPVLGARPTRYPRPRRYHRPRSIPLLPLLVSRADQRKKKTWIDVRQS